MLVSTLLLTILSQGQWLWHSYDTGGPGIESSHQQLLLSNHFLFTVCRKDENSEKGKGCREWPFYATSLIDLTDTRELGALFRTCCSLNMRSNPPSVSLRTKPIRRPLDKHKDLQRFCERVCSGLYKFESTKFILLRFPLILH